MAPDRAISHKRKRSNIPDSLQTTPRSTPRKRQKTKIDDEAAAAPAQSTQSAADSEPFYEARAILEERKGQYRIDWADNPETGETYEPTWEPKRNANKQLVDDWKLRKLAEKERKRQKQKHPSAPARPATAGSPQTYTSPTPALPSAAAPKRTQHPPKRRRIVHSSSPEPQPESEPSYLPVHSSNTDDSERVIPETEPQDNGPRPEAQVVVTQPTDYNPSEYEHFSVSQILWGSSQTTQAVASQLQPTQANADTSQSVESPQPGLRAYCIPAERLLQQPRFGNGAVVPDSQSLPGDSSYVPSTQTRSGAESQLVQTQTQPVDSTATRAAQQDNLASASAQFTNSQQDNSAPVPETDQIEDVLSSPAEHNYHEDQVPLQRESPLQTASSASSPPPTGSPEKSTPSQNRIDGTGFSLEGQVNTHSATASEEAHGCEEAESPSRPPSPKSKPQDKEQATSASAQTQIASGGDLIFRNFDAAEKISQVQAAAGATSSTEGQQEPAQQTAGSENDTCNQRLPEREVSPSGKEIDGSGNTAAESAARFSTAQYKTQTISGDGSAGSEKVQPFITCPEKRVSEPIEPSSNTAESPRQDPAEGSTQDVTDPDNPLEFQPAQKKIVLELQSSSNSGLNCLERANSQSRSQPWQPAQEVPEIELDNSQSCDYTNSARSRSSAHSEESRETQAAKRKDSSRYWVESGVLGQADANVVRRPPQQTESDVPGPKDIVPSIEDRTETPIRGYYRKSSRGMPQTPQPPNSSMGNFDSTPQKSLTEQLREVQARSKAERERKKAELLAKYDNPAPKSPSLEASTRSPSVIPPHHAQPPMEPQYTLMPSNLSAESRPEVRSPQNEHSLPAANHPGSDTEMRDYTSSGVLLDEPIIGEAEYLIGLSMEGLQGDQYRREISFKKEEITDFTENDPPDGSSINGVRELLENVGNVITHMDLGYANEDSLTQYDANSKVLVAWSNNSSTKFRFLGGVLDRLRHSKLHFVILGRAGALTDIIETFVGGMGIQYSRGGAIDRQAFDARESLFVTILATDFQDVDTRIPPAQLIFAMDSTVKCQEPRIKALRNHLRGAKDSIPMITPIAMNSLEHVERCIAPSLQGLAREKLVVRFMTELRQLAGRVDVSTKADHAVNLIVPSIETDLDHHEAWPLPRVGSIKQDVHFDESMISSLSVSSSVPMGTINSSAGQKRHLEVEENEPAKRTRLTPQPDPDTVNPNDITRISDSVPRPTQHHGLSSNPELDEHIKAYRKDEKLRQEFKYMKERLKQFEEALEVCQTEKEGQKDLIFHLKKENTDLKLSQINYSERIRTQNSTIESLRNERDIIKEQLTETRQQLASSTIPEVAEREQLRRERDDALAKLERAQKTRETENKESEFFRSQYQDASNRASELSAENTLLTRQLREFERLASGERERARRLTLNAVTDAYRDEAEMLRAQLRDREEIIRQKTEEIKAIRGRQGVGTRAGSVPRSPRITGGPGSRGGSPAPSGLGGHGRLGALRNINA
ncbi:class II histone deacetylase complex subunits 2 and 3-domain-containing protein [Macrophomina phaseolina]|uniref:Class II histone deacetylase complex subunits 2 and 3-domain-containing protein n=1 Tax=Macrophomina phaseolina TaxID=35725 RepID=A0ABQ8GEZ8_9PEZI|nr:class II histone deacetylase complex subunits 2 and 3-domain-containing protein [Macrophomina phaseolina]